MTSVVVCRLDRSMHQSAACFLFVGGDDNASYLATCSALNVLENSMTAPLVWVRCSSPCGSSDLHTMLGHLRE